MAKKATKAPGKAKGKRGARKATERPKIAPRLTTAKKRAFLEAFASTGTVTHAAKAAGVDRTAPHRWAESDPEFKAAWDAAQDEASDALEKEARRRAIEGTDEPVFYQGAKCGTIRRYSDSLLIFLLKGNRPGKFRDNAVIEHTGPGGGPVQTETQAQIVHDDSRVSQILGVMSAHGFLPKPPEESET